MIIIYYGSGSAKIVCVAVLIYEYWGTPSGKIIKLSLGAADRGEQTENRNN